MAGTKAHSLPGGSIIHSDNGEASEGKLELKDVLLIETTDNRRLEFEVVGIVEDEEHHAFGVCYNEGEDEFVVTDENGRILEDDVLAQEVLDDFLVLAEESAHAPENN